MTDAQRFDLVCDGQPPADGDTEAAVDRVAQHFGLAHAQAKRLFAGKPVRIKRDLALEQARRWQQRLHALGLGCRVVANDGAAENRTDPAPSAGKGSGRVATPQAAAAQAAPSSAGPSDISTARAAPAPAAPAANEDGETRRVTEIHAAVGDPSASWHWTLPASLASLALAAAVIPLGYAGLVIAVGYFGGQQLFGQLQHVTQLGALPGVAAYLVGLAVLAAVLGALLEPFLPVDAPDRAALNPPREDQPELFAWLDQAAALVHAPKPTWLSLVCPPLLRVRPQPGLRGIVAPTPGVTLAPAVLRAVPRRELTGLLAGWLMAYRSPVGGRSLAALYWVEDWLWHRCRGADPWERRIAGYVRSDMPGLRLVWRPLRGLLRLPRLLLWPLSALSTVLRGVAEGNLRSYARACHEHICGRGSWAGSRNRLVALATAYASLDEQVRAQWEQGALAHDLAVWPAQAVGPIPLGPGSDAAPGLANAEDLCRRLALRHCRYDLDVPVTGDRLVAPAQRRQRIASDPDVASLRRRFLGLVVDERCLPVPKPDSVQDEEGRREPEELLQDLVDHLRQATPSIESRAQRYEQVMARARELGVKLALLRDAPKVARRAYGLGTRERQALQREQHALERERAQLDNELAGYELQMGKRLALALGCDTAARRGGAGSERLRAVINSLHKLQRQLALLGDTRAALAALRADALRHGTGGNGTGGAQGVLRRYLQDCTAALAHIDRELGKLPCAVVPGLGEQPQYSTVLGHCVRGDDMPDAVDQALFAIDSRLSLIRSWRRSALAQLAEQAESAERRVLLHPLRRSG